MTISPRRVGIGLGSLGRILGSLAAMSFLPGAVLAQGTGSLMGLVLDEEARTPIADAVVTLPGAAFGTRTDSHGWFQLLDVPAETVILRVEADGFVTFVESIEIAPLEESLIHVHLHAVATVLDQLLVQVGAIDDPSRGHSEGSVIGSGALDRTAADLLMARVPGLSAAQPQGSAGEGVRIRLRGVSSFVLTEEPHIYLDGVRIDAGGQSGAMLTLAEVPASSVARIRVLRGPASTSMYPGAAAGVILVETLRPDG